MMVPFVLSISAIQKTKKHSISLSIKMSHQCYHQHFSMPQNTRQSWRPSPNANALLKNTNVSFLYYTIKIRGTRMTHFWPYHHRKYQKWPKKSAKLPGTYLFVKWITQPLTPLSCGQNENGIFWVSVNVFGVFQGRMQQGKNSTLSISVINQNKWSQKSNWGLKCICQQKPQSKKVAAAECVCVPWR